MTAPSLLDELEGVVAYAWRKDGMKGWALGHNPPTQNMLDFDKYEVRELAFRTHHTEIADMAKRLEAAERDSKRMDWVEDRAHALDWDPNQPMKRVIRGDDGAEFCGDTWREQIDAATQEGEG